MELTPLYVNFVDYKKAFDSLDKETSWCTYEVRQPDSELLWQIQLIAECLMKGSWRRCLR